MYSRNVKFDVNLSLVSPSFGNLRVYNRVVPPGHLAELRRDFNEMLEKQVPFDTLPELKRLERLKSDVFDHNEIIQDVVKYFVEECRHVRGTSEDEVLVQGLHGLQGPKSLESLNSPKSLNSQNSRTWHQYYCKHVGILVVSRENVIDKFRIRDSKLEFSQVIEPGSMVVFDDANVFHCVDVIGKSRGSLGLRDALLLSMGKV